MVPIGLGFAMSSYETAFSAAVQMDEVKSRKHISFITFYGGVASSVILAINCRYWSVRARGNMCGLRLKFGFDGGAHPPS